MGFFDKLRQKKELERLELALRANPSPALHVELAEHHIAAGDIARAFAVAHAGKEAFPASEAVFKLYASLKKRQSQDQIRTLQRQIETSPSASTYSQLAAIYREVHEEERAIDLCREAIEKYPADDGPHQVLGEIRLARFHAEKHRRDGRLAIDHLEKAAERNERNYKALLALARLYLEIGAVGHCLKRARQVQTFAPADPALKLLLDQAAACPRPEQEDLDELLRQVESSGRLTVRIDAARTKKAPRTTQKKRLAARTGFDPERVEREIDSLRRLPGAAAVGFLGEDGRLLAFRDGEGDAETMSADRFQEGIAEFAGAAATHTQKLDIGTLVSAEIAGPFGQILVYHLEKAVLGLYFSESQSADRIGGQVQHFVDRCYAGPAAEEGGD